MIRTILGVILGYVVMFVFVFVTLTAAYLILGADRTFQPGSYEVTPLWLVVMLLLSFVAAIVGGRVCRIIAGGRIAVMLLAILVFALGAVSAGVTILASGPPPARTAETSNLQAMMSGREPVSVVLALPLIGVFGVLIGGRSKGNRR